MQSNIEDSVAVRTLNWTAVPGRGEAVHYSNVRGDMFGRGPYSAYVHFRGGTDNGVHRHAHDLPTIVLRGTFYAVIAGERIEYPAGTHYHLPAGLVHESGATAAGDCLLYQWQEGPFNLERVTS
ncbi:TPA: cupin domain-containing protein [Pseudomonas putida]